jgi:gamma-glutamyltranspeptidase/glutathione hydrolase
MSRSGWVTLVLAALAAPAPAHHPVKARHAMVVAQEPLAADAGLAVLAAGGNAIDAAVTTAFVLAVTHPSAGNLGGGGFLLARFARGQTSFIDFREKAPRKASRAMYVGPNGGLTGESVVGWRASAVPGTVRGLELAHRKYGRKKWGELLAPAVRLAKEGFPVPWHLAESLRHAKQLAAFPESRRIFQRDGRYYEPGELLVQPELARTLGRIARGGAAEFYEGETARRLAREMETHGGLITLEDLKEYRAVERPVLRGTYKGYEILSAPPPSSGGVALLQMLGMLEGSGYERAGYGAAATIHFVAEVMRRAYADRSEHLADPDYHRVPLERLLDRSYLEERRRSIDPERATPSDQVRPGEFAERESGETTHLSIVDAEGNAVALTYTINGSFGSGVTAPGLGFLLNNEMDDFAAKPGEPNMFGLIQGEANAIEPGKRPLSSMTPTIVLEDGRLLLVLGAPGGSRIINGVLQVLLNVVDFKMNLQDAVSRPRFHHQWKPDTLAMEEGFSPDTIALLERRGHRISPIPTVATVEAVRVAGGWLEGATDPRGHGKAAGY